LHTHKLKGELSGVWACTVDYDNRILFELVKNSEEEEIFLLTLGSHDEVLSSKTKLIGHSKKPRCG